MGAGRVCLSLTHNERPERTASGAGAGGSPFLLLVLPQPPSHTHIGKADRGGRRPSAATRAPASRGRLRPPPRLAGTAPRRGTLPPLGPAAASFGGAGAAASTPPRSAVGPGLLPPGGICFAPRDPHPSAVPPPPRSARPRRRPRGRPERRLPRNSAGASHTTRAGRGGHALPEAAGSCSRLRGREGAAAGNAAARGGTGHWRRPCAERGDGAKDGEEARLAFASPPESLLGVVWGVGERSGARGGSASAPGCEGRLCERAEI